MLTLDQMMHQLHALFEIIIYNNVIILLNALRLLCGTCKTLLDDLLGLRIPAPQTIKQCLCIRRYDKEQQCLWKLLLIFKAPCSSISMNDIAPLLHLALHIFPRRPVIISAIFCVLYKLIVCNQLFKCFSCPAKSIPFRLPLPHAGCVWWRKWKAHTVRNAPSEASSESPFSHTGKPGYDNKNSFSIHAPLPFLPARTAAVWQTVWQWYPAEPPKAPPDRSPAQ